MISLPKELSISDIFSLQNVQIVCKKYSLSSVQLNQTSQSFLEKIKFNYSDEGKIQYYSQQFLNSLSRQQCKINQQFLDEFANFYNSKKQVKIQVSKKQSQLFSQILVQTGLYSSIDFNVYRNILQGQTLLATTLAFMVKETKQYLKKCQIAFCLSFLALSGKRIAFIHKVHQQKNHKGEVYFSDKIYQYCDIEVSESNFKIQVKCKRVQDPYSMRCSPQVYGVVYDTLWHVQQHLQNLINKFHFKNILHNNMQYPNLDLNSDAGVLQGDFLVCSLNQIGSISFLRCQRILNKHLGKNQLEKYSPKNLLNLKMLLQRTVHCVSDNKIISTPSNIDTMNIHDYQKDIFYSQCKLYEKYSVLMQNLYKILHLQILCAIQGLKNVYQIKKKQFFKNEFIQNSYFLLQANTNLIDKKKSYQFIKKQWNLNL